MTNALTDIPWIRTVDESGVSHLTLVDVLKRSHQVGFFLDKNVPGYVFGAQFRLLRDVLAVVLRSHPDYQQGEEQDLSEDLLADGVPEIALEKGIEKLAACADIFSATNPFLQRPVAPMTHPKDNARLLEAGKQPVKKLLPAMPSDQGEDFWNLSVAQGEALDLPQAVLHLAIHHHYSMAGNNIYDGFKCAMGAPGIRFLGKGFAATEIFWGGESLLESLLQSLPKSWVEGDGLPAWSDRVGKTALQSDGSEHPLWRGTWSSNTAACHWEEGQLTGVRIGGAPDTWFLPTMGTTKESQKAWWDQRNTEDLMYLYIPNQQGEQKAQRIDFGRDATDLAVEWAAESKVEKAKLHKAAAFFSRDYAPLNFIRHQIEGTASSPSIRATQVYTPDPQRWVFDASEGLQERIVQRATLIRDLHNLVCSPFRRKNENDKKRELEGKAVAVLETLEDLKNDASASFWREITPVYIELIHQNATENEVISQDIRVETFAAAIRAFDMVTLAYKNQDRAQFEFVRGNLESRLRWRLRTVADTSEKEGS